MADSFINHVASGSTDTFSIPFGYLAQAHIGVELDGVPTAFTFPTPAQVQITSGNPGAGVIVRIARTTPRDVQQIIWQDAANLTASDLNTADLQMLYITQESFDLSTNSLRLAADDTWDAELKRIKNVATPTAGSDASTKAYADALVLGNIPAGLYDSQEFSFAVDGAGPGFTLNSEPATINATLLWKNDAILEVGTDYTIAGTTLTLVVALISLDELVYRNFGLGSSTPLLSDASVSTAKLAPDAVTGAKIADDSLDSEHYVAASIDNEHLADDAVGPDELIDTAVTPGTYTNSEVTVDQQGRVTAVSSGAGVSASLLPVVSVTFNGTGTPAVLDGFGVASVTDNGVGDYTLVFDTDFANVNYRVALSYEAEGAGKTNRTFAVSFGGRAVGSLRLIAGSGAAASTYFDFPTMSVTIWGELA